MSGIVGILRLDGAPVDRAVLWRLTQDMKVRGPDEQRVWTDRCVGLGHAMLRTTFESERETQPCSLDGQIWITGDARIDGRRELTETLRSNGCNVAGAAPDAELILHAYRLWADQCVGHLIGDFAFAIWDVAHHRLFCARDHFGVKPFFYARTKREFIFGNTLRTLRRHPAVSSTLNDSALLDFLLFEKITEADHTAFDDIRKLPPAHTLSISPERTTSPRRYWSVPLDRTVRYRSREEYAEHFRGLLTAAVSDRLRTDRVSVSMSGGLDSTSIAATARTVSGTAVRAYTMVYDRILPDQERHYSGLVARHLDIPIHYQSVDDYRLYQGWEEAGFPGPEPIHAPLHAIGRDLVARARESARVMLVGEGGDPLLLPSRRCLGTMLKSGRLLTVVRDAMWLWRTTRRFPPMGFRTTLRRGQGGVREEVSPPRWLNPQLSAEFDIPRRVKSYAAMKHPNHPRAEACDSLSDPYWSYWFEQGDAGALQEPLEARYPFFDRRVVEFAVSIPAIPWCVEKNILRAAMVGLLPETVGRRPKTPLGSDGIWERREEVPHVIHRLWDPVPELTRFVDVQGVSTGPFETPRALNLTLLPLSLNLWLREWRRNSVGQGGVA